jgi:ACR3 family arsenite transporter
LSEGKSVQIFRESLERRQIVIYLGAVFLAAMTAMLAPRAEALEAAINPMLAIMLFVTFLQVPLSDVGKAWIRLRFLAALLTANFVALPPLVILLAKLFGVDRTVQLGVLLVLLTPCIDYVVVFAQLGRADSRLLLATTPILLIAQLLLMPLYLGAFLGEDASRLIQAGPFVHAFLQLIVIPLGLSGLLQAWASRSQVGERLLTNLSILPVPATALVLFVVIAAMASKLGTTMDAALQVAPIYIVFAVAAPLIGWIVGRSFGLDASAGRSIAFSAGTRNSLVVLPLALAVPETNVSLPAIIVTQTLVELLSELLYVRLIPRLGKRRMQSSATHVPSRSRSKNSVD